MDKLENVIKGLHQCLMDNKSDEHNTQCFKCPYFEHDVSISKCMGELRDDALELLKAQEPVKPTRYQEGRWFKTWRCGACRGTLVFRNGKDKPKYCTDCGRAVKWE